MSFARALRKLYPDWQKVKLTKIGYSVQREQAIIDLLKAHNAAKAEFVIRARMNALEWVLMLDGRWSKDSEVGLIQLSSVEQDRLIADELIKMNDKLEKLTGVKTP
jgi:hypothetical protein